MTSAQSGRAVTYLLIGGGLASATAAEEIRKRDPNGSIVIICKEPQRPYNRPPLSKEYLRGEINAEGTYGNGGIYVHEPEWYDEQRVELLHGEATALDPAAKAVCLADGQTLTYSKLLLAMGGRPRALDAPNANLPGIYYLRTVADSGVIRNELAQHGKRVVVVGSGFIGLETAANSLFRSAQVTIVEPLDRPWPSMLPPAMSDYLAKQYERRGATLRYQHSVTGFTAGKDGRLAGVEITPVGDSVAAEPETIACDLAIVGVGILLNSDLAQQAGLGVDPRQGIVVDDHLRTSAADIYAAGDLAAYPDPVLGRMHFEHWDNAIATGQTVGANMTGGDEVYRHVPYFFSDQFDLAINMLGYPTPSAHVVVRGALARDQFSAFFIDDGTMRGVLMVNDDAQMDLARDLIAEAAPVPDPHALLDLNFDLASLRPGPETAADEKSASADDTK
ncbi:MAG TPA: FAD/NAD(P)-binding oxidoreductase [Ktedonobacterales bacterium]|jgi:3-phenylpropionate/trans-cinnamate dioxygenase ferredoxin reductase subunit